MQQNQIVFQQPVVSPLMLADRLIHLAQDADRVGMRQAATRLIDLAHAVFDEPGAWSNASAHDISRSPV